MQTDPQHLQWKTDNDLKTAIISTILKSKILPLIMVFR